MVLQSYLMNVWVTCAWSNIRAGLATPGLKRITPKRMLHLPLKWSSGIIIE